jgi:hypothetical protein
MSRLTSLSGRSLDIFVRGPWRRNQPGGSLRRTGATDACLPRFLERCHAVTWAYRRKIFARMCNEPVDKERGHADWPKIAQE